MRACISLILLLDHGPQGKPMPETPEIPEELPLADEAAAVACGNDKPKGNGKGKGNGEMRRF
jgi:hypothetical protein